MSTILLIDDDLQLRSLLARALTKAGYTIREAGNGNQGLEEIAASAPDLVLTDLVMPDREGLELIQEVQRLYPEIPIVAMSGNAGPAQGDFLKVAGKMGAIATLAKPFSIQEMLEAVRSVLGDSMPT